MKRSSIIIVLALLLINAGSVRCEEASVKTRLAEEFKWLKEETLVWSASKYQQKSSEAPSLVSVVTADDIKKFGYRTLADVLQSVSGFYVNYDRRYRYVGVRGFKNPGDFNTKVLVMIDGHVINDNVYQMGYIGAEFPLDVDLIDRVEITRGPGSCLYGTGAFLGVINVITKKAKDMNGSEISAEAGSLDTYKGRASFGKKISDNSDVLLSFSRYKSSGEKNLYYKEFNDPATDNGVSENLDAEGTYDFFFKTSFHDLTLTGGYGSREKDIPIAPYGTWFNTPFSLTDKRSYAELKYDHSFDKDTNVSSRFYYDRYAYDGNYPYQGMREDGRPYMYYTRERDLSEWIGGELKLTKTVFSKHTFTISAEYQYNLHQNVYFYNEDPYQSVLHTDDPSPIYAVYFQDEYKVMNNLILNGGFRYDHYESFGGTVNPRFALIYSPLNDTTVKLIYGTAFRSPNVYELYSNKLAQGSSNLNPDNITTYEAIVEQRFGKHLRGSVSAFYYKIDGLITAVYFQDVLFAFENKRNITAKGMEAEIRAKWENNITASLNYTFQDVGDTDALLVSPRHLIKTNLVLPLIQNKVFISSEGQYTSSRKTLTGNVDDYFIMNTTLLCMNIVKRLDFSASVYNLFDKIYSDPGSIAEFSQESIEQNGRTFRFKLTYSFP